MNPSTHQCRVSSREKRLEDGKRCAVDEKCLKPKKRSLTEEDKDICFLSDDAALLDHNYCHLLLNDRGTQTDFPYEDLEVLTSKIAQRATWSNYKQHNTMKALVGITPTG